jgi:hypothetical protein
MTNAMVNDKEATNAMKWGSDLDPTPLFRGKVVAV